MTDMQQTATTARPPVQFSIRRVIIHYGVYISLGMILLAAAILTPGLYSSQTIFVMLRQASQLGIVAIGQTLALLVAGLDLSVSGVIVLTSVIIANVGAGQDSNLLLAILVALGFGELIGLANGLLITRRNVPPFVATLGVLVLVEGAQNAYTRGVPGGFVPAGLNVMNAALGPIPVPVVLWILLSIGFIIILRRTPYGRRIYAVGSNREAARLSGIRVGRVLLTVYILSSLMAATAGIVLTGYIGYVDRFLGQGLDLDSIAAAVVGGTTFTGGRGGLAGTAAGVLLIQILSTMALLLGLDVQVQLIIKGLVVIGAVALYSLASRQ